MLNLLLSVYLLVLSPIWCNIIGWWFRFCCAHALSGYSISKFLVLIEWQVFCDTFHFGSWDSSLLFVRLKLRFRNAVVTVLWYRAIRFVRIEPSLCVIWLFVLRFGRHGFAISMFLQCVYVVIALPLRCNRAPFTT